MPQRGQHVASLWCESLLGGNLPGGVYIGVQDLCSGSQFDKHSELYFTGTMQRKTTRRSRVFAKLIKELQGLVWIVAGKPKAL